QEPSGSAEQRPDPSAGTAALPAASQPQPFRQEEGEAMKRTQVMLGIVALICAAARPTSASPQIKIFGQNYNVVAQSRAQTYKNGVQIHLDSGANGVNNFAGVYFAQGKDRSDDRLWFACRIYNNDAGKGDQLYYLEGSDDQGNFTPAVSNAKSF